MSRIVVLFLNSSSTTTWASIKWLLREFVALRRHAPHTQESDFVFNIIVLEGKDVGSSAGIAEHISYSAEKRGSQSLPYFQRRMMAKKYKISSYWSVRRTWSPQHKHHATADILAHVVYYVLEIQKSSHRIARDRDIHLSSVVSAIKSELKELNIRTLFCRVSWNGRIPRRSIFVGEEENLFYVGATRAKYRLTLLTTDNVQKAKLFYWANGA